MFWVSLSIISLFCSHIIFKVCFFFGILLYLGFVSCLFFSLPIVSCFRISMLFAYAFLLFILVCSFSMVFVMYFVSIISFLPFVYSPNNHFLCTILCQLIAMDF